jgi:hypothetical protein
VQAVYTWSSDVSGEPEHMIYIYVTGNVEKATELSAYLEYPRSNENAAVGATFFTTRPLDDFFRNFRAACHDMAFGDSISSKAYIDRGSYIRSNLLHEIASMGALRQTRTT